MIPAWWHALVALLAIVAAAVWPLTPALPSGDALQARLGAAVLAAIACGLLAVIRGGRPGVWIGVSIGSAAAAVILLVAHFNAVAGCVARVRRPAGHHRPWLRRGCRVVRRRQSRPRPVRSAARRRRRAGTYLVGGVDRVVPAVGELGRNGDDSVVRRQHRRAGSSRTASLSVQAANEPHLPWRAQPAGAPVYDAFLSYRHAEPDKTHAIDILESLERRGLRVAIDFRDFAANEHFLSEMERCIKESRFVLCVITSQYLASDHTSEEAIISKTLDLADRRRRLVPLVFERVELPVWLHGLVGIDFTESASVEPTERLLGLFRP